MSDIIDIANETAEWQRAMGIREALFNARKLRPIRRCYNCDEPLDSGLYCDKECGDDFEKRIGK
jgi:hypothetical protein